MSSLIRGDGEAVRGDAKSAVVEVGRIVIGVAVGGRILAVGVSNCCMVL